METDSLEITKNTKPKAWVSYSQQEYQDAADKLVHQTFKTVNSNAESGGVRVPLSKAQHAPYIGITSLLAKGISIPLEFTKNPGKYIGPYKQINMVLNGSEEVTDDQDQINIIRAELKRISEIGYTDCSYLSPRLRQILIPRENGYISVTPISSHGVGQVLRSALNEHHEQIRTKAIDSKQYRYLVTASLPIGGANAINVGMEAHGVRTPLVGSAPQAENNLKYALALYYKGADLWLPRSLLTRYVEWRDQIEGNIFANLETREQHAQWMKTFARFTLNYGNELHEVLYEHKDALPVPEDAEEDFDPLTAMTYQKSLFQKGLLNPALRDLDWKRDAAKAIRDVIVSFQKNEQRKYEYSMTELKAMSDRLKEAL